MRTIEVNVESDVNKTLDLGYRGENLATEIRFDLSPWRELFGEGTVSFSAQRKNDAAPYIVQLHTDENAASWYVDSTDTGVEGTGKAELQYFVGETCVKSGVWTTKVKTALGTPSDVPVTPDVVNVLERIAAEAAGSADDARHSAEDAAASETAAKASEEAAAGSASDAQDAAERAEHAANAIEDMTVTAHSVAGDPTVEKTVSEETGLVNLDFGIPSGGGGGGGGGDGLPPGGTRGQYLVKQSSLDGDAVWADLPVYDGSYEVTPLANADTIMSTGGRYLDRDVVLKAIPYQEVSNTSGGKTATIGGI